MRSLPTWSYLSGMIRYAPGISFLHGLLIGRDDALGSAAGADCQHLFRHAHWRWRSPGGHQCACRAAELLAAARATLWLIAGFVESTMRFTMRGLLGRHLLRHILNRPGVAALPYPVDETISRFRDDAYAAEDNLDWTDETVSQAVIALAALAVLLRIDAGVTLAALVPLTAGDAHRPGRDAGTGRRDYQHGEPWHGAGHAARGWADPGR